MKVVPLSEAKAQLRRYGKLCQVEPVVVTVRGIPAFQLAPLDGEDDLIDRLLEKNQRFRELLDARSKEKSISAKAAARQL